MIARACALAGCAALTACGQVDGGTEQPDASPDAPDGMPARCDASAPFTTVAPLPDLPAGTWYSPRLSPDELILYTSGNHAGAQQDDVFFASRSSRQASFGELRLLVPTATTMEHNPTVIPSGLTVVFDSSRTGARRLYVATRSSTLSEFGAGDPLAGVASTVPEFGDVDPFVTADEQELWFNSNRNGGLGAGDLWRATRSGSAFANPMAVQALNSGADDGLPALGADRLTIYFHSSRGGPGAPGMTDIWTSRRTTANDGWAPPTAVAELNTDAIEYPGWLSTDNCRLYFSSNRDGAMKMYMAERRP